MTVLDRAPVTGDAGRVTDEQRRPDPEVPERARRRTFTAQYKLDVLAAYDAAAPGEKGAVLRREGLYSSHIVEWRRAGYRRAGGPGPASRPASARCPGRADRPAAEGEGPAGAGAGQGPLRGGSPSKTAGALGDALRGRGHRSEVDAWLRGDRRPGPAAGGARGVRGGRCRPGWLLPPSPGQPGTPPAAAGATPRPGAAAGAGPGRAGVNSGALHSERFVDLAPAEVYATLLDEGRTSARCAPSTDRACGQ